jgi:hypothetical protein
MHPAIACIRLTRPDKLTGPARSRLSRQLRIFLECEVAHTQKTPARLHLVNETSDLDSPPAGEQRATTQTTLMLILGHYPGDREHKGTRK